MTHEIPTRDENESAVAFAFRVSRVYHDHFRTCVACQAHGEECFACEAGEESLDPTFHACTCEVCEPKGFGVRLRALYVGTRKIREAARRIGAIP